MFNGPETADKYGNGARCGCSVAKSDVLETAITRERKASKKNGAAQ